jgi:hypothetical protein
MAGGGRRHRGPADGGRQVHRVLWWAYGVFSVTSPVWWLMFRNHPAGTHLIQCK